MILDVINGVCSLVRWGTDALSLWNAVNKETQPQTSENNLTTVERVTDVGALVINGGCMIGNYYCKTDLEYKPYLENGKKVELLMNGINGAAKCINAVNNSNETGENQSLGNALLITTATCARTVSEIVDNSPNNNLTPMLQSFEIGLKLSNCLQSKPDTVIQSQAMVSPPVIPSIAIADSDLHLQVTELQGQLGLLEADKNQAEENFKKAEEQAKERLEIELNKAKEQAKEKLEIELEKANKQAEEKLEAELSKANKQAEENFEKAEEKLKEEAEELQKNQNKLLLEKEKELTKVRQRLDIAIKELEGSSDEEFSTEEKSIQIDIANRTNITSYTAIEEAQGLEDKPSNNFLASLKSQKVKLNRINNAQGKYQEIKPKNEPSSLVKAFVSHYADASNKIESSSNANDGASDDDWKLEV